MTEVDTDPKGRFVLFRVTRYNNKVLWVSATSGHNTREQLVRGRSFDRLQNYMKKNVREMKTKLYLKTLKLKWIKLTEIVETKYKDFVDVVPKVQDIQSLH